MREQKRQMSGRAPAAVGLALALAGGALALGTPAGAQEVPPTASADAGCDGSEGFIEVSIVDEFSTTYNVYIDEVLVAEGVTDSDGFTYIYGPYEDGVHNVRVFWNGGEEDILVVDLTVDCVPDETTTTTTAAPTSSTTAAPTTATTAPPGAAAAVVAAPRYTG